MVVAFERAFQGVDLLPCGVVGACSDFAGTLTVTRLPGLAPAGTVKANVPPPGLAACTGSPARTCFGMLTDTVTSGSTLRVDPGPQPSGITSVVVFFEFGSATVSRSPARKP